MSLSPLAFGIICGVCTLTVIYFAIGLVAAVRWAVRRLRRSRIGTIAHQADGPYRRIGQKRRR